MNFPWADPGIAHYKHTQCIGLSFKEEPSLIFHKSPHFTQEFILMSRAWKYTPLPTLSMWQLLSRCHTKKEGSLLSLHLYTCRPLLGRVNKMATHSDSIWVNLVLKVLWKAQTAATGSHFSLMSIILFIWSYCCSIEIQYRSSNLVYLTRDAVTAWGYSFIF